MRLRVLAWVITVAVLACNREPATSDTAVDTKTQSPPTSVVAPGAGACGGADRPCLWSEVSEKTLRRIQGVADLAIETLRSGKTPEQVAETLRAEADVSVLSANDEMIRYHVKGGRPAWVWLVSPRPQPTIGAPMAMPLAMEAPASAQPTTPVGKQDPGTKPHKKVLILSPFRWQWQMSTRWNRQHGADADARATVTDDETETLEKHFDAVPDYEGGVTRKENHLDGDTIRFGVDVTDFASWAEYDVVHVSTHGTSCAAGATDCEPALATGHLLRLPGNKEHGQELLESYNRAGVDIGFIPFTDEPTKLEMAKRLSPPLRLEQVVGVDEGGTAMDGASGYTAGPFLLLTTTWFRDKYGASLEDKIIFLSACSSGSQDAALPKVLAGRGTSVIGWDKTMGLHEATVSAYYFWALALGYYHPDIFSRKSKAPDDEPRLPGGMTIAEVFGRLDESTSEATFTQGPLKSIVIEGVLSEDDGTGATLRPDGDSKTRAREIITLLRGGKKPRRLVDGDLVELEGAPGDGKPDKLRLLAEVIGVGSSDKAADYVIGVDVDGTTASQTWSPNEEIEPGRWRGEATIDLGFDLEAGKTFDLEPWVDLPGGGRSRWRYEDIGVEYFVVTISGPGLTGKETFSIDPRRMGFTAHGGSSDGFVTTFQDRDARTSVSGDGSILDWFMGGVSGPGFAALGAHPLGEGEGGSNGWSMYVWRQAQDCPARFVGCTAIAISTDQGTLEVSRFDLGKGLTRPLETGPTIVTATFEVSAHATNIGPYKGETYALQGAFSRLE
jgi:hypothetical protein